MVLLNSFEFSDLNINAASPATSGSDPASEQITGTL